MDLALSNGGIDNMIHIEHIFMSNQKLDEVKSLVEELSNESQQIINILTSMRPSPPEEWINDLNNKTNDHIDCLIDYINFAKDRVAEYNRLEAEAIEIIKKNPRHKNRDSNE